MMVMVVMMVQLGDGRQRRRGSSSFRAFKTGWREKYGRLLHLLIVIPTRRRSWPLAWCCMVTPGQPRRLNSGSIHRCRVRVLLLMLINYQASEYG
ncbi:hypothetical protein TanjilG_12176 [Lupinus angustifolius]|uniref:Uncharacterized protein n=1 Tax=Lupinus angustifolius TaxID=3871 RepID=A0A1J7H8T5_LUPAN|nr:hypothetical protein TanjilG_12176 [Lupinus angustifolius]